MSGAELVIQTKFSPSLAASTTSILYHSWRITCVFCCLTNLVVVAMNHLDRTVGRHNVNSGGSKNPHFWCDVNSIRIILIFPRGRVSLMSVERMQGKTTVFVSGGYRDRTAASRVVIALRRTFHRSSCYAEQEEFGQSHVGNQSSWKTPVYKS